MTYDEFFKYALIVVANLGGFTGITVYLIKHFSKTVAERLSKLYELKINKELEDYKSDLSDTSHVSKAKFDAEFNLYKDISLEFMLAFDEIQKTFFSDDGLCDNIATGIEQISKTRKLLYQCAPYLPDLTYRHLSDVLLSFNKQIETHQILLDDIENQDDLMSKDDCEILRHETIAILRNNIVGLKIQK